VEAKHDVLSTIVAECVFGSGIGGSSIRPGLAAAAAAAAAILSPVMAFLLLLFLGRGGFLCLRSHGVWIVGRFDEYATSPCTCFYRSNFSYLLAV
jgi:hypothetical protein